jgi:hypothetical protein
LTRPSILFARKLDRRIKSGDDAVFEALLYARSRLLTAQKNRRPEGRRF